MKYIVCFTGTTSDNYPHVKDNFYMHSTQRKTFNNLDDAIAIAELLATANPKAKFYVAKLCTVSKIHQPVVTTTLT